MFFFFFMFWTKFDEFFSSFHNLSCVVLIIRWIRNNKNKASGQVLLSIYMCNDSGVYTPSL
jgi:hypothetical protein